jgi:hypothetical protein
MRSRAVSPGTVTSSLTRLSGPFRAKAPSQRGDRRRSIARPSRCRREPASVGKILPPGRPGMTVRISPPAVGRPDFGTQRSGVQISPTRHDAEGLLTGPLAAYGAGPVSHRSRTASRSLIPRREIEELRSHRICGRPLLLVDHLGVGAPRPDTTTVATSSCSATCPRSEPSTTMRPGPRSSAPERPCASPASRPAAPAEREAGDQPATSAHPRRPIHVGPGRSSPSPPPCPPLRPPGLPGARRPRTSHEFVAGHGFSHCHSLQPGGTRRASGP